MKWKKTNGWLEKSIWKIKDVVDASIQVFRHQYVYQRTKSAWISKSLEEYLDVKHVIPCQWYWCLANCYDGIGFKGDEVITADFTFAATVEVIALLQLTPF
jgi:dTDP-4-amino-4,6-dideoxygalactose transaminase